MKKNDCHSGFREKRHMKQMSMILPVKSENPGKLSSSMWQASIRLLKRVPTGSSGCPTQPSKLVIEVMLLWGSSVEERGIEREKDVKGREALIAASWQNIEFNLKMKVYIIPKLWTILSSKSLPVNHYKRYWLPRKTPKHLFNSCAQGTELTLLFTLWNYVE